METDVEIVNRVKKGNKEAYGIVVKKYRKKAYFLALGFVGDTNDALDLSQMSFIKTYRSLSSFDQKRPFLPWFYAIFRNLCLNFVKRKKVIPMVPLEEANQSDPALCQEGHGEDMKEIVGRAISLLSVDAREVIFLKYFQEYSYREMAQILDCPVGTIMSRLYYARKKLKENLEKYLE